MDNELGNIKLPPQVVELEEAVLGALMIERDAIMEVMDILTPDSFYKKKHTFIYEAILSLNSNLEPVDVLTVAQELKKVKKLEEIGGPLYLTALTEKVSSSAHAQFHARIIAQKSIQRGLINTSNEIIKKAYDEAVDVDDLLNFTENEIFKISEGTVKKEAVSIGSAMDQAIEDIKEAGGKADGLSGVPSGFTVLDRVTSGWQRTDLVIIAARPSMGKTAFVISMCRNMAVDHNIPVLVFSLEMSAVQIVTRLIVGETGISNDKIKNGNLTQAEWTQLETQTRKLYDAPMYIDDTPAISISEFRSKCRRLKMQHNIGLVVVDYLQLMTTGAKGGAAMREQEVSLISRTLKAIAKELDVPVLALSQLNRGLESRSADKRPQLSDLRESGAIEQDADIVMFINRPERYGITEDANGRSMIGMGNIILAKHRNGSIGDVWLKFTPNGAKFGDLDYESNKIFNAEWEALQQESLVMQSSMNETAESDFESEASSQAPELSGAGMGDFQNEPPF
jgi:replicative DNA helicase